MQVDRDKQDNARPPLPPFLIALIAVLAVAAGSLLVAASMTLVMTVLGGAGAGNALADIPARLADGSFTNAAVVVIFAVTYLIMAIGKLPGFQLDRAGAALLGASLMIGVGAMPLEAAYRAVDFDTITLLLGMMILVANLRLSGFFELVGNALVTRAHHPLALLAIVALVAGAFSAFLVNDAVCLVMTPLTLHIVKRLQRNPIPYLLAIPLASNAGSTATITGNPQNMIIGSLSHIPYATFAASLWPVAVIGVAMTILLVALFHPREFLTGERLPRIAPRPVRAHRFLMAKSVVAAAIMMALFFAGQPVAKVAIVGGALLLLTRSVKADKIYRDIDWPLLLMFTGLFIVVAAFDAVILHPEAGAPALALDLDRPSILAAATAALSNIVSNVPAVLMLKPFLVTTADPQRSWLLVAMASTLAGNFTLVGSVANLIVAQRAKADGVTIGFWPYLRIGAPLSVMSIIFGVWWLS